MLLFPLLVYYAGIEKRNGKKKKKKKQTTNATKSKFSLKMQVSMTTALTRAPLYKQSQLGAAAHYLLIK